MPIAVKLSRKFYDAFGDDVVNELVEVLNQVDLAYRDTLHELNESNFSRLDERFARVDERFARFDERFTRFEEKLARFGEELRTEMNAGFARADARLDREVAAVRTEMQAGFAQADAKLEQRTAGVHTELAKVRTEIAASRGELVKWMFLFWAGTALTVVGLLKF